MWGKRSALLTQLLIVGLVGNTLACHGIEMVHRSDWGAVEPKGIDTIKMPVSHIIIAHTVTPQCFSKESCSSQMRSMQNHHITLNWGDIGYNFVIGGDGRVYEGVGWSREGAHTYRWNSKSYGIAFIGNFNRDIPNDKMLLAARKLIVCGIQIGAIAEDRWLHGHRDALCTASPGDALYAIIQKWPRFKGGPLPGKTCL